MQTLDYKGIKSTRFLLIAACMVGVTAGWVVNAVYGIGDVTALIWVDVLKWGAGLYMASEIGAKGASAYKERTK